MESVPLNDLARWREGEVDAILAAVKRVCDSGMFMLGNETGRLESELSRILQVGHVNCVANGTDALTLALLTLGVEPGDKVVTATNAGGYTSTAAVRVGAIPVPIDVDPLTAQMDWRSLDAALSSIAGVRAVVLTHLYGLMGEVTAISKICVDHGVPLIEDCAQAIGARVDGRPAGSFGSMSTFSFYPTKNLGALGDGGAVATDDHSLARKARALAQYGWGSRYSVDIPRGFNSRIDEIQSAILSLRLKHLEANNERRRTIALQYSRILNDGKRFMFARDDESYVAHLAVMSTPTAEADHEHLRNHGVMTGVHYPINDGEQSAWSGITLSTSCPNADRLSKSIVTLPCFPEMSDAEIDRVSQALRSLP